MRSKTQSVVEQLEGRVHGYTRNTIENTERNTRGSLSNFIVSLRLRNYKRNVGQRSGNSSVFKRIPRRVDNERKETREEVGFVGKQNGSKYSIGSWSYFLSSRGDNDNFHAACSRRRKTEASPGYRRWDGSSGYVGFAQIPRFDR